MITAVVAAVTVTAVATTIIINIQARIKKKGRWLVRIYYGCG
jgi:hypothetical protein